MANRVVIGWMGLALLAMTAACSGDDTAPVSDGGPDGAAGTDARADAPLGRGGSGVGGGGGQDAAPDTAVSDGQASDAADSSPGDGGADVAADVVAQTDAADARDAAAAPDGADASRDAGDAGGVARGEYLVMNLLACTDCHTPRRGDGMPDAARLLAGNAAFGMAPIGPDGGMVPIGAANLTPDPTTGLGSWTDTQIKQAFLDGIKKDGKPLISLMPYYAFHNMSAGDADAIVAFLRSIPAVSNDIPVHPDLLAPALPIDAASIPNTTLPPADPNYASAVRGRYLAAQTGACIECHTKHTGLNVGASPGPALDTAKYFAGGQVYRRDQFDLPPALPAQIVSANITPDPITGIFGLAPSAIVNILLRGVAPGGLEICPPMPVGPVGPYGGLTNEDAIDIANYVLSLPPISNDTGPLCDFRVATPSDGGNEGGTDASGQ